MTLGRRMEHGRLARVGKDFRKEEEFIRSDLRQQGRLPAEGADPVFLASAAFRNTSIC